jgi:hypothetical protein
MLGQRQAGVSAATVQLQLYPPRLTLFHVDYARKQWAEVLSRKMRTMARRLRSEDEEDSHQHMAAEYERVISQLQSEVRPLRRGLISHALCPTWHAVGLPQPQSPRCRYSSSN